MIEVTKDILKKIYQPRSREARKYDFGLLMVIGGSEFYSGSPALSSLAAFKAGVDMVRIIAPTRAANIIASFSPILAAYPLEGSYLEMKHLSTLISLTESAKAAARGKAAVVIGGGMGRSEDTKKTVLEYLKKISLPAVIDADAIYAIADKDKAEVIAGKNFLISPHLYEFFILTGKDISKLSLKEKTKIVQEEAKQLKTTILMKGAIDIISDGKEVALNKTGTAYMTVGGSGDVLAGVAGALLARGISAFEAGQAAAYLNGLAGELAGKKLGESMTATDLIDSIPEVLKF